ncbi:MAG: DEAD/DEAH box helicase family protein [Candidatus Obscuribacterales bacterium]|nr:DEAD/DEAH box helicase family protein [Candidatus Obscuribacterales bacterium]
MTTTHTVMTLKELPLRTTYSSVDSDLYRELIVPLLSRSVSYDRAVGFFSSLWLKEVALGFAHFITNSGRARILTSVKLSPTDWETIKQAGLGQSPEGVVEFAINQAVEELKANLERQTLGALSWLIQNDILDLRFSVPIGRLDGGIMHSKLSLFYDAQNNAVAVFGSQNDSSQAAINEETLSVFTNWGIGKDYFYDYEKSFAEKWKGNDTTITTVGIPEAARRNLIMVGEQYQELFRGKTVNNPSAKASRQTRDYQEKAIQAWIQNDCQGLFEMATGSGKTFTAISAALRVLADKGRLAIVVLAPFTHLVEQWTNELEQYELSPIVCMGSYTTWQAEVKRKMLEFRAGISKSLCIVATHSTASGAKFREVMDKLPAPWLLIADEVHNLGASKLRNALPESADFRIGLTATASRWFDDQGTDFLRQYFKKTVIEYGLKDAIDAGALASYSYFPVCVELTHDELQEYANLTRQISRAVLNAGIEDEHVQHLLRKRARLVGTASEKIPKLLALIAEHRQRALTEQGRYTHNLYYCSPGEHADVVAALSGLGLKVHKFVYDVSQTERASILQAFADGELEGLVAIKCLDEGVDIPATQRAYILASTTNPKEFIQRRGRLLRNYPGKQPPEIYDFVVGPWGYINDYPHDLAQSLLRRELPRIVEFNSLSRTKHTATKTVFEACKFYGMEDMLYQEPWEIYQNTQRRPD